MKKLIAVLLVLMMALACLTAGAEGSPAETAEATVSAPTATVSVELSVDKELLNSMMLNAGMPEAQAGLIDPILDLLNVLKLRVIGADGGAQIDLDVNGNTAVSLGMAASEDSLQIASSLIPNYLLTVPVETIRNFVQQYMPGAVAGGAGAGGVDMAAVSEAVTGYVNTFMEAVGTAVKPGEPEQGTFEFEGIAFNTRTPVDIDVKTIADAVKKLVSDLLNDEKISGLIKQTTPDFDPAEVMKGLEESLAEDRLPEVKTDVYSSTENMGIAYIAAEVTPKDAEAAAGTVTMLMDQVAGSIQMKMTDAKSGAVMGLTGGREGALIYAEEGEQYFALGFAMGENGVLCLNLFAGVKDRPVATLTVSMTTEGERTLSTDPEGRTVLSIADLQGENAQQALMGLQQDLMVNLGQLMQIPEVAGVIAAYSRMMQMQQQPVVEADPSAWKTMGDVLSLETTNCSYGLSSQDRTKFVVVLEYGAKYWMVTADFPEELLEQYNAIDIFEEGHEAKERAMIDPLEVTDIVDLETLAIPQGELDQWTGRSAAEMLEAGWEPNGYEVMGNSLFIHMVCGDFQYNVDFGNTVKLPGADEELSLDGAEIVSVTFAGPSYNFNP